MAHRRAVAVRKAGVVVRGTDEAVEIDFERAAHRSIPGVSFSGIVSVALAINDKGALMADPEIELIGIPDKTADGGVMENIAYNAVVETLDTLPKARRRDPDSVAEAIRRGVRSAVAQVWRKKPNVTVHVLIV